GVAVLVGPCLRLHGGVRLRNAVARAASVVRHGPQNRGVTRGGLVAQAFLPVQTRKKRRQECLCQQVTIMIRFNCATCGREYVLADALRHLPLLCKQCGHRLVVPDPQPEPVAPIAAPVAEPLPYAPAAEEGSASEGRLMALPSVSDSEVDLFK